MRDQGGISTLPECLLCTEDWRTRQRLPDRDRDLLRRQSEVWVEPRESARTGTVVRKAKRRSASDRRATVR